ncbi:MAG TPA: DUF427 domain-containing protein [Amaricoccus sp.]|jgi:uncharacterized protein (DUF427 family)|nr:DUF427 domain-containing protein [Amaricoccus sp.]
MPDRPVIVAADGTWVVRAGGAVIGESSRALEVIEADGRGVIYFPREDLGMVFLESSPTIGPRGSLGEARYFGIVTKSEILADAAWSYEAPPEVSARIAGYIAFDARRVAVEEV